MSDSFEDRLRGALAARADQVTSESLRPEVPISDPDAGRRRSPAPLLPRWAPVLAAASALIVIAAVSALTLMPDRLSRPSTSDPAQPAVVRPGERTFDGVGFMVPAGWTFRRLVEGIGCLQAAGTPQTLDACTPSGIEIRVGTFVGWPAGSLDRADGWSLDQECPASGPGASRERVTSNRITERATQRVGGQAADYRMWKVRCGADRDFTVRLWWLPQATATLHTEALDPQYDALVDRFVESVDVSGRTAGAGTRR